MKLSTHHLYLNDSDCTECNINDDDKADEEEATAPSTVTQEVVAFTAHRR